MLAMVGGCCCPCGCHRRGRGCYGCVGRPNQRGVAPGAAPSPPSRNRQSTRWASRRSWVRLVARVRGNSNEVNDLFAGRRGRSGLSPRLLCRQARSPPPPPLAWAATCQGCSPPGIHLAGVACLSGETICCPGGRSLWLFSFSFARSLARRCSTRSPRSVAPWRLARSLAGLRAACLRLPAHALLCARGRWRLSRPPRFDLALAPPRVLVCARPGPRSRVPAGEVDAVPTKSHAFPPAGDV